jgi:hypothetical protein
LPATSPRTRALPAPCGSVREVGVEYLREIFLPDAGDAELDRDSQARARLRLWTFFSARVTHAAVTSSDPKIAEIVFRLSTCAGMPALNDAVDVYHEVLKERGEWPIK